MAALHRALPQRPPRPLPHQHDARGAVIRQIFTAENADQARRRLADAVSSLESRLARIARLLEEAEDDVLAFFAFPAAQHSKLRSTNPLERFNREIGRRTDVVGIAPPPRGRCYGSIACRADRAAIGRITSLIIAFIVGTRVTVDHAGATYRRRRHLGLSRLRSVLGTTAGYASPRRRPRSRSRSRSVPAMTGPDLDAAE